MNQNPIRRRTLLTGAAALPVFGILARQEDAVQFTRKMATGQEPSHPVNLRAAEAIAKIKQATHWKQKSGAHAWSLLEKTTGPLK